jgi:hypothetical protein
VAGEQRREGGFLPDFWRRTPYTCPPRLIYFARQIFQPPR